MAWPVAALRQVVPPGASVVAHAAAANTFRGQPHVAARWWGRDRPVLALGRRSVRRLRHKVRATPPQQLAARSLQSKVAHAVKRSVRLILLGSTVLGQLTFSLLLCKLYLLPSHEHAQWLKLHPGIELVCVVLTVWWFIVVPNSMLFRKSVRRCVLWVCNWSLNWVPEWYRSHLARSLSQLAERFCRGCLRFTAVCILVTTIPSSWQLPVSSQLRFLDLNGDGIIEADEITDWVLDFLKRLFIAMRTLDLGQFLLDIKQLPAEDMSEKLSLVRASGKLGFEGFAIKFFTEQQNSGFAVLLDQLLTSLIYGVMLVSCLKVVGLKIQTILALGGVGGLAVGLASKNVVANGIAGIIIFLQRRFFNGDEIESRSKKIRGMVAHIGFQSTVINQLDGMPITVPNSVLLDDALVNRTTKHFRMFEEKIHVVLPDLSHLRTILQKAGEALENHPKVLTTNEVKAIKARLKGALKIYPPIVCYAGTSDRGLIIYIRAYVSGSLSNDAFRRSKSDILLRINRVILASGGSFAFRPLSPLGSASNNEENSKEKEAPLLEMEESKEDL